MKIVASLNKVNGSNHEGYFLDKDSYDTVVDYDADIYDTEGNLLVVFRKGILNDTLSQLREYEIFDYFKRVACYMLNDNRGFAAGRVSDFHTSTGRPRLSTGQYNVLMKGKRKKNSFSNFKEIENCLEQGQDPAPYLWLARSYDHLDWDGFLLQIKNSPVDSWVQSFSEFFDEFVDAQKRANLCYSNVIGAFSRTPRNPYCRLSAITSAYPEEYEYFSPLYQKVSEISSLAFPEKADFVKEYLKKADPYYSLFRTMFTSITVNWNFRTASHFDGRNFDGGFATLTALEKGEYSEHYLVFPEIRIAFDLRQGDTISADTCNLLHGNTEKVGEGERVSLVFFTRQDIADTCHSRPLDECRKAFYHYAKEKRLGASNRSGWKGGSKGMYDTPEWYSFLEQYKKENNVDFQLLDKDKKNA